MFMAGDELVVLIDLGNKSYIVSHSPRKPTTSPSPTPRVDAHIISGRDRKPEAEPALHCF